jgi:hypothetical protein
MKVGGILHFKAAGTQLRAKGSFTYRLSGVERTPVIGADGGVYFSETTRPGMISGQLVDSNDIDLSALYAMENETFELALANGKTIVLRNGWYSGAGEATTEEGEVPVEFTGKSCEEIL